jgi:hypothetical protein
MRAPDPHLILCLDARRVNQRVDPKQEVKPADHLGEHGVSPVEV